MSSFTIPSFRTRARAFAGFLFVKKKDGMILLIVDARQADHHHTRPPHTLFGCSSALSDIDLSDECLLQTSGIEPFSENLCGAGRDVRDGFYQFSNCSSRLELATSESTKSTTQKLTGSHRSSPTISCGRLLRPCQRVGLGRRTRLLRACRQHQCAWHSP